MVEVHVVESFVFRHSRIVDENIQSPYPRIHFGKQVRHVRPNAQIGPQRDGPAADLADNGLC